MAARPVVTLSGHVTDATGAAIPGASVSVETAAGRVLATTLTGSGGTYQLSFEAQGAAVRERVQANGFSSSITEGLVLEEGVARVEDVMLKAGASESVTVSSGAAIGNGQIATVAQLGMLGTLDASSTPFSVEAFTDQLVLDQQAQTVSEVLLNVPGVQDANGRYSEDSYLQLRGFALDPGASLINGLPYLVDYRSPSLEDIERVELFKGPSSLLNGTNEDSSVAGTINLVTKRATNRPLLRFDGGYSSNSDFEGHLDGGRRWFDNGVFGLRGQLGGRDGATPIDNQTDHVATAGIEADVRTERFRASVDASDQYRGLVAERGALYLGSNLTAVPQAPKITTSIFDRSTTFTKHEAFVLGHAEYDPSSHVEIFGSFGHSQSPENYVGPYFPTITDNTGDVTLYDIPYHGEEHVNVGRVGTRLTFATGGVQHQITANGDFTHQASGYFFEFLNALQTNIYHPVPLSPLTSHTVPLKNIQDTQSTHNDSFAVADLITAFRGRLVLIGGLRDQSIDVTTLGANGSSGANSNVNVFTPCTSACVDSKSAVSPSGAGLLHVTSHLSVYANYIQDLEEGPTAPVGATNGGQIFPPSVSQQQEAGAKYDFARAGATLAFFRITEPNGLVINNTFGLFGQQRNEGIELELFGNVVPSVRVTGGLTLIDAQQQNTGNPATEGKRAQGVPSLQLTEGAEWSVPGTSGLILTGRITASSGQYGDAAELLRIPAWARLDIGGRYTLPFKYEPTLRVNVANITGNNYWESGFQGLSYGTPRSLRVSTGFRF